MSALKDILVKFGANALLLLFIMGVGMFVFRKLFPPKVDVEYQQLVIENTNLKRTRDSVQLVNAKLALKTDSLIRATMLREQQNKELERDREKAKQKADQLEDSLRVAGKITKEVDQLLDAKNQEIEGLEATIALKEQDKLDLQQVVANHVQEIRNRDKLLAEEEAHSDRLQQKLDKMDRDRRGKTLFGLPLPRITVNATWGIDPETLETHKVIGIGPSWSF